MNTTMQYLKALRAIEAGDYQAFLGAARHVPNKTLDLLERAASRPGIDGRDMTIAMLLESRDIPRELYLTVCKNAINFGHVERVCTLANNARSCVKDFDASFYSEIVAAALPEHKEIADTVKRYCEYMLTWGAGPAITYI